MVAEYAYEPLPIQGRKLTFKDDPCNYLRTMMSSAMKNESVKRLLKGLKIISPHVAIITITLLYTAFGAVVLVELEEPSEREDIEKRVDLFSDVYTNFIDANWNICETTENTLIEVDWRNTIEMGLRNLSKMHEEQFDIDARPIMSKWTFFTAYLYAITLVGGCGYERIFVRTTTAKIFDIVFTLLGIPLLFLVAADTGALLTGAFQRFVKHVRYCYACARNYTQQLNKSHSTDDIVSSVFEETITPIKTSTGLILHLLLYLFIMLGYCTLGGLIFMGYESDFTFIQGFHFSYNIIITVGLGDIHVTTWSYMACVVLYMLFGFSVLSMCINMASVYMVEVFQQIHYYGQPKPIGFRRYSDLRHVLNIARQIADENPDIDNWDQVNEYLASGLNTMLPFVPRHIMLWNYIDEPNSEKRSLIRRHSFQMELICNHMTDRLEARPEESKGGMGYKKHSKSAAAILTMLRN